MKAKKGKPIPPSTSARVNTMCGKGFDTDSLEDLRFRRDLAARDGDFAHAFHTASAIDRALMRRNSKLSKP